MHKLVVVGGGAGGLELVTLLGRIRPLVKDGLTQITLVDGQPTHIWKPLLHEVATGALNTGEDEVNFFSHCQSHNSLFRLGSMNGLNLQRKIIQIAPLKIAGKEICGPREIPYDTLVLAVGAVPDTFGTPGIHDHCLFLNNPREAERLRLKFLTHALSVVYGSSSVPKLRIGIVGAGATGVELATEIHRTMAALQIHGFEASVQLEISVIEAGPRVLPAGNEKLAQFATKEMLKMKIDVRTNTAIKSADEKGFVLGDGGRMDKEIRIWTAGIKAPMWLKDTELKVNRQNRIEVDKFLRVKGQQDVYAMGDCACTPMSDKQMEICLPATAQVAHQQAIWMTQHLKSKLLNKGKDPEDSKPFVYNPQGILVSLGDTTAVGSLVGLGKTDLQVRGGLAKGIYNSLYRKHQAVLYGWPRTGVLWIGDKLRRVAVPTLKFH